MDNRFSAVSQIRAFYPKGVTKYAPCDLYTYILQNFDKNCNKYFCLTFLNFLFILCAFCIEYKSCEKFSFHPYKKQAPHWRRLLDTKTIIYVQQHASPPRQLPYRSIRNIPTKQARSRYARKYHEHRHVLSVQGWSLPSTHKPHCRVPR